jgi:tetratricopeptide (TPR) repeat protein
MIAQLILSLWLASGQAADGSPRAEEQFHEGLKAYDAHAYARALTLFESAYAVSPLPEIQFDIAQTYRALGDCKKAVDHFDRFLSAVPSDDPLAERARSRRQELLACARGDATEARAESLPRALPVAETAVAAPEPSASIRIASVAPSRTVGTGRQVARVGCAGGAGATLAAGLAGAILELQAQSTQQTVALTSTWDSAAQRADERGKTLAETGTVLLISAGVLALGTAAACWIGWSGQHRD